MLTGESFDRFTLLLVALGGLLLLGPLVNHLSAAVEISAVLFLVLMVSTVVALDLRRSVLAVAMLLLAIGFAYETALHNGAIVVAEPAILMLTPLAYLLIVGTAVVGLVRAVLGHERVTAHTVRGGGGRLPAPGRRLVVAVRGRGVADA